MAVVSGEAAGSGTMARHVARAAARLFARHGYDATSVRMIVEAAGVTKPTLYYHFKSKGGLAHALLTVPLTGLVAKLRGIADSGDDPVSALTRLFLAHFEFCREEPDRFRLYYALCFGPLDNPLAQELLRFGAELDEVWLATAGRLAGAGVVAPERAGDLVSFCRSLITMSAMEFFCDATTELDAARAGRLVADLLHGFATPDYSGRGSRP